MDARFRLALRKPEGGWMSRLPHSGWLWMGLLLAMGCSGAPRIVRLETGGGAPLTFIPRPATPVEVDADDFEEALAQLARDVPAPTHGLVRQTWRTKGTPPAADELTRSYRRWCERKGLPGDCLHLLVGGGSLDDAGRRTLALSIALDSVWDETLESLEGMADPMAVRSAIVTSMAVYLTLWLLPEPVSKGAAAVLTASLIAWLGYDTVWGLIRGWIRLSDEAAMATRFDQLHAAGERYGQVMGANAARVFVMLTTAAIGSTAGLAQKAPTLPGYTQATAVAAREGGFRLSSVIRTQTPVATGRASPLKMTRPPSVP
ncbi:hypothetical protein MYSTI_00230 [Myxococcus stipitatus DSM 14675]|uniref:Uncharacterized protein n=2 Tax=Myxococcus stipitatus TaxID=83455 RepID=L7U506_MYXSD|nr:hypothetical protein MYSTI_00230 [Myxococcus stipitatus DSM 14675]